MNQGKMEIFKWKLGDCSNHGISSHYDEVLIWSEYDANAPDNAVVIIEDVIMNKPRIYAAPANKPGDWAMFGGTLIYTSNACVPHSGTPIKLYDRFERGEKYGD